MTAARIPGAERLGCDLVPAHGTELHPRWPLLAAIAANQHGLVTTKQALEVMGLRTMRREIDRGLLIPFRYGVQLLAGAPRTEWQPLMAACLACGPFVAASHRSAALLHELPGIARPPEPEITVYGADSRRLAQVIGHRSDFLDPADLGVVRNIPTTAVPRTIIDMGRFVTTYLQARMMDHARRRRLCTYEDVAACLDRIGGRGRPGSGRLRKIVDRRIARGADPGDSGLEFDVVEALHRRGVPEFVQQHQVVCGPHVYLIDVAWPDRLVGIEVKGDIHLDPSVADNDAERENQLTAAGWRIFEARPTTNLNRLITQVLGAIQRQQLALFRTRDTPPPNGRLRRR